MDTQHYQVIRDLVRERAGIVLGEDKQYLVDSRMRSVCREFGCKGIPELIAAIRARKSGIEVAVVEALTTNETQFFRDVHPFEALVKEVVPGMMTRNADRKKLRFWCAACSSGQEPVSLAIALLESGLPLHGWDWSIRATDINKKMIERCQAGFYSHLEIGRGFPEDKLETYFRSDAKGWTLRPKILDLLDYSTLNLTQEWRIPEPIDIVLLRNVLIYFSPETKAKILNRVYRSMPPGGVLLLGTAESTLGLCDGFVPEVVGRTTIFRRAGAMARSA
ncbi:MAG TPA: protein-glutamate O-methyltransferase CheR [Planctomycetes bacterium]|nr:protein-glutamate O-methyltransferase CheR [Planctomycetota bacterium]